MYVCVIIVNIIYLVTYASAREEICKTPVTHCEQFNVNVNKSWKYFTAAKVFISTFNFLKKF